MLDALLATRARALESQALRVVNRISPNLYVRANETELQEVLAMALDNAIRFSPPGGEITVTSEVMVGEAELRIRDRGRGAGPDQLESLFEPFFGGLAPPRGLRPVTGHGAAMIEQAGSRIWASAGLGRGLPDHPLAGLTCRSGPCPRRRGNRRRIPETAIERNQVSGVCRRLYRLSRKGSPTGGPQEPEVNRHFSAG